MQIRALFVSLCGAVFLIGTLLVAMPEARAADGKALFEAKKCNKCHAVQSVGIAATKAKPDKEGKLPPDLSDAGSKHAADFLSDYLQKKQPLNGKKHKAKFKGSDEELQALVQWLAGLKGK